MENNTEEANWGDTKDGELPIPDFPKMELVQTTNEDSITDAFVGKTG